jgi:hypothetical protein
MSLVPSPDWNQEKEILRFQTQNVTQNENAELELRLRVCSSETKSKLLMYSWASTTAEGRLDCRTLGAEKWTELYAVGVGESEKTVPQWKGN